MGETQDFYEDLHLKMLHPKILEDALTFSSFNARVVGSLSTLDTSPSNAEEAIIVIAKAQAEFHNNFLKLFEGIPLLDFLLRGGQRNEILGMIALSGVEYDQEVLGGFACYHANNSTLLALGGSTTYYVATGSTYASVDLFYHHNAEPPILEVESSKFVRPISSTAFDPLSTTLMGESEYFVNGEKWRILSPPLEIADSDSFPIEIRIPVREGMSSGYWNHFFSIAFT